MREILVVLLAVLLVLTWPAAAQASSSKVTDGDDIGHPLDLQSVTLKTKGATILATVVMHDAFTDEQLAAPNTIGVDFKIDAKVTRGGALRMIDGKLKGEVCTNRRGGPVLGSTCSKVAATRVNRRAVLMTFKRSTISTAPVLNWRAGALVLTSSCSNPLDCLDLAPGKLSDFKTWRV